MDDEIKIEALEAMAQMILDMAGEDDTDPDELVTKKFWKALPGEARELFEESAELAAKAARIMGRAAANATMAMRGHESTLSGIAFMGAAEALNELLGGSA